MIPYLPAQAGNINITKDDTYTALVALTYFTLQAKLPRTLQLNKLHTSLG